LYCSGSRRLLQGWIKYVVAGPYLESDIGNKAAFWIGNPVENIMHNEKEEFWTWRVK
jgi:hypothetical protein